VIPTVNKLTDRAIAQAVNRRLHTAAARIRVQFNSCGICGGQSGTGTGFLRVLQFTCQFLFHLLFHTHLSSGGGTTGQLVADVQSGLSLTPSKETKKLINSLHLECAFVVLFFFFGATAPIWALACLHETLRFTSVF
jgi:hypothetical protein